MAVSQNGMVALAVVLLSLWIVLYGYLQLRDTVTNTQRGDTALNEDQVKEVHQRRNKLKRIQDIPDNELTGEEVASRVYWATIDETDVMAGKAVNGVYPINKDPVHYVNPLDPHGNDLSYLHRNPFKRHSHGDIQNNIQGGDEDAKLEANVE